MSLEFTEYSIATPKGGALPQMPNGGENATQSLAIGAASVQSAAFNANTDLIIISQLSANARVAFGPNPVAVTTGAGQTRLLNAGSEYSFRVQPGQKLAVIAA